MSEIRKANPALARVSTTRAPAPASLPHAPASLPGLRVLRSKKNGRGDWWVCFKAMEDVMKLEAVFRPQR
jgi:hypothetical protein